MARSSQDSSAPDPTAIRALRALARASRVMERQLGDLTAAQYRVLAAVADGAERASGIAARLALGKPTISASVDALCQRGLLTRTQQEHDQRVSALRLTAAGADTLAQVEADMATRLTALVERTDDPVAVLAALAQLGPALDEALAQRLSASGRRTTASDGG